MSRTTAATLAGNHTGNPMTKNGAMTTHTVALMRKLTRSAMSNSAGHRVVAAQVAAVRDADDHRRDHDRRDCGQPHLRGE